MTYKTDDMQAAIPTEVVTIDLFSKMCLRVERIVGPTEHTGFSKLR